MPDQIKLNAAPLASFFADESGAVTVDWVVLTAAIVGFGMLVIVPIGYSTDSVATQTGAYVSNVPVGYHSSTP